jgi:Zn finger protein HypA/HybF involved in hydrogenase expression
MFYRQFSAITDILNPDFVEEFDYWLATLPQRSKKNITVSVVSARLGVSYSLAESILRYAEKQKILDKHYIIKCPDCNNILEKVSQDELAEALLDPVYCDECDQDKHITLDNVYTAYRVIQEPNVSEEEIAKAIEKRLNQGDSTTVNFTVADSLSHDINTLYEVFYNPDESAYQKFQELQEKLDLDYGKNTTAQGNALEKLIKEIFNQIKGVKCTNDVKTKTNQFDCTALCGIKPVTLSVFSSLAPYFIIECKNEPDKKPNNTYCNKLISIMESNAAQLGIVFGRKDAASTCFTIAREHYLTNKNSAQQRIIITCSDADLTYLIKDRVNLLQYLEYKIFQITANAPNVTYEMFLSKQS